MFGGQLEALGHVLDGRRIGPKGCLVERGQPLGDARDPQQKAERAAPAPRDRPRVDAAQFLQHRSRIANAVQGRADAVELKAHATKGVRV